jgi:hypothetical protein
MITFKEWMELVEFKITEGCYYYSNVEDLFSLNRWDDDQDGSVVVWCLIPPTTRGCMRWRCVTIRTTGHTD